LSPQNPHALSLAQAHDYSKSVVTTLIMEARLAPFYRGLEDYDESYTEESIGKLLTELREKDFEENVPNSVVEAMKAEREHATGIGSVTKKIGIHKNKESRVEEEKAERDKRERRAYLGAVECPICFLVRTVTTTERCTNADAPELPIKHQHVAMLPAADLYRVLRPDQAQRSDTDAPRVRTGMLSFLR